jgi:quercetin 2,3-dioxygenase
VLAPGDVQWMTAGRGIIHRELAFRDEHAHTLQLWVNLPASGKLAGTRYQDLPAASHAVVTGPGVTMSVISGSAGIPGGSGAVTGPAANHWPITGLLLTIEPGSGLRQRLPAHDRAFRYVLGGRVAAAGQDLPCGQVAWSGPVGRAGESELELTAPDGEEAARLMLFSGRPCDGLAASS